MKIGFSFWKRHTHLKISSLLGLLTAGLIQVLVLHLLIGYPSLTYSGVIIRGISLIGIPFLASLFAGKMAAFTITKIQNILLTNLSHSPTNDIEQLHPHTFSTAATLDIDHLYQLWREFFTHVGFNLPVLLYLTGWLVLKSHPLNIGGIAVLLLILASLTHKMAKRLKAKQREHYEAYSNLQDQIQNYVENVFQFRLYGSEKNYLRSLGRNLSSFSQLTAKLGQSRQLNSTYISSVLLLFLWLGLWFIQNNQTMSPADIAVVTIVFLEIKRIGTDVLNTAHTYQRALESAKRLSQWLPIEAPVKLEEPRLLPTAPLRIHNLTFQYKNSEKTINYPDLEIQVGEKVWLKGQNGRGKSTLWKILTGLYTNPETTIWLNNSARHSDGITPFFDHLSAVTEPAQCYSGILWDIIGNFSAQRDEVLQWLSANQLLHQFDTYPAQLDTVYDSAINNLSAGQLKWLLLIQAFFMQPDMLILDEPFSSLDLKRQQLTVQLCNQLPGTTTLIVISHHSIPIAFDKTISL